MWDPRGGLFNPGQGGEDRLPGREDAQAELRTMTGEQAGRQVLLTRSTCLNASQGKQEHMVYSRRKQSISELEGYGLAKGQAGE